MSNILKVTCGIVIALAILAGFAILKPVVVSALLWPTIENIALREPYTGITTDGSVMKGLFPIRKTGVDITPVLLAAQAFITSLDKDQQDKLQFDVEDSEWRRWANIHISTRQGVGLGEMTPPQREAATGLLAASLSPRGLQTSLDIMRLEGHLADLMNDHNQYGEHRYWFTIMGKPSSTEPWGWQIDGHHLIINFFVLSDQVVMTPTFMGSEPPYANEGRFKGTRILDDETLAGLSLINSLDTQQRELAILSAVKTGNNNYGELFSDNVIVPAQGLLLKDLNIEQKAIAVRLIRLHIDNLREDHAAIKLAEVMDHWAETRLAWVGETAPDSVFYYRIQSPVVLIEFDHQSPVALQGSGPSREHVHTVVRTPNGNDYGKDLLSQHVKTHPH